MMRSDIDHYRGLDVWNPVPRAELWRLVEPLPLERGLRVLDVGCGRAATLIDFAERLDARITGVDRSSAALQLARNDLAERAPKAEAEWIESAMNDLAFGDETFDVILAVGGPYRNDALEKTLRLYARWLRSDGYLLYGDGFWMQPPPDAYLEATGLGHDELLSRDAFLALAQQCGLETVDHLIATREAWDHFEGKVLENHEAYARRRADDPDVETMIAHKRVWDAAQRRFGRDTMGFSVDVFRLRS